VRVFTITLLILSTLLSEDTIQIKRTYYETGELSSETRYVNGKKDGLATHYYPNGTIRMKTTYKDDKDVINERYRPDGSMSSNFDRQTENVSKYKFMDKDGKVSWNSEWHQDPNDKDKYTHYEHEEDFTIKVDRKNGFELEAPAVIFKDNPDKKDGKVGLYNKDGTVIYEAEVKNGRVDGEITVDYGYSKGLHSYRDGKINGMQKRYEDNVLIHEIEYRDNKKEGIYRAYYKDGTPKHEGYYEEDRLSGEYISYRKDGSVKGKMRFDKKNRTTLRQYDRDGNLIQIVRFDGRYSLDLSDVNKTTLYQQSLLYPDGKLYREFNRTKKGDRVFIYYPTGELKFSIPYKNHKANGEVKKFYKNGRLRALIPMSKNKIEGSVRVYYPNGNSLKYTLPYKKDLLSGTKIKYDRKSQKSDYNMTYNKGVLDLSTPLRFKQNECNTTIYYENRNVEYNITCQKDTKLIKGYYHNGMIEYEISHTKGKKEGVSYIYHGKREFDELTTLGKLKVLDTPNNTHYEITFANDKRNGATKIYDKKGELAKEIEYKNNLREGMSIEFGVTKYGKRATKTETEYKNDKKDGIELYYVEGKLERETIYKNGKKDGREMRKEWGRKIISDYQNDKKQGFETKYDSDGNIIDGKEYNNGEIVYEIEEVMNE
jgi:antitoxin component YwqK of YwqJK toxin-antitoxin module